MPRECQCELAGRQVDTQSQREDTVNRIFCSYPELGLVGLKGISKNF